MRLLFNNLNRRDFHGLTLSTAASTTLKSVGINMDPPGLKSLFGDIKVALEETADTRLSNALAQNAHGVFYTNRRSSAFQFSLSFLKRVWGQGELPKTIVDKTEDVLKRHWASVDLTKAKDDATREAWITNQRAILNPQSPKDIAKRRELIKYWLDWKTMDVLDMGDAVKHVATIHSVLEGGPHSTLNTDTAAKQSKLDLTQIFTNGRDRLRQEEEELANSLELLEQMQRDDEPLESYSGDPRAWDTETRQRFYWQSIHWLRYQLDELRRELESIDHATDFFAPDNRSSQTTTPTFNRRGLFEFLRGKSPN